MPQGPPKAVQAASDAEQQSVSYGTSGVPLGDRSQIGRLEAASGGGEAWHCARTSPPPIGEFKLCRWVTTVCGNRQVSYGEGARRADGMWGRANQVEMTPPEQWQDLPAGPSASRERWESQAASGGGEQPRGWLTGEEREVLSYFREACQGQHERAIGNNSPRWGEIYGRRAAILERLLARSSPPEQPRGWLTAEERGSIQHAANLAKANWSYSVAQELENLLARSSPPEVVLPEVWGNVGKDVVMVKSEVIAALAAAGVAVREVGK